MQVQLFRGFLMRALPCLLGLRGGGGGGGGGSGANNPADLPPRSTTLGFNLRDQTGVALGFMMEL